MLKLTRGAYALPETSLAFKTGDWRDQQHPRHYHYVAPCHNACPAGEDAQAYLAKVAENNPRAAWETLVAINPLPAIAGRICHHPCETACNRGAYDEPIAIHGVERYLGDQAIAEGWDYPLLEKPGPEVAEVAIIGAGPAGLSAAYHLLRLGYHPVVFDALNEPGGTLRTGIPPYRLPAEVTSAETERLLASGIEWMPNYRLGSRIHLDDLRQSYAAIILAPGTMKAREWSVGGVIPPGLHQGIELLKEWMDVGRVPNIESAAVVGGGNTAVDAARVLKRGGVKEVHIITHNGMPGSDADPSDVMRAIPREVEQAQEEGILIHSHRGVQRLIMHGNRVIGLEMVHMKKFPDARGRLVRKAFEGTETVMHIQQVFAATGQMVDQYGLEIILDGKSYFQTDYWGRMSSHSGIFVAGDAREDSIGMMSAAVGDGHRAAQAVHAFLQGSELSQPMARSVVEVDRLNLNYFEPFARARHPILPVEKRLGEEEIEGSLSGNQVHDESVRCFSCGNCMACDNCWTLCPDQAVLKTRELASDGSHYVFDYDFCKGCGLCAHECPTGFILMEDE